MAGVSLRFAVCLLSSAPVLSLSSCPTLWNPLDYSPPGSSIHGVFQARILEQVAISKQVAFLEPTWVRLEFSSFHSPAVSDNITCPTAMEQLSPNKGPQNGRQSRIVDFESPWLWESPEMTSDFPRQNSRRGQRFMSLTGLFSRSTWPSGPGIPHCWLTSTLCE